MSATTLYYIANPPRWFSSSSAARKINSSASVEQVPIDSTQATWLSERRILAPQKTITDKNKLAEFLTSLAVPKNTLGIIAPNPIIPIPSIPSIPPNTSNNDVNSIIDRIVLLNQEEITQILAVAQGRYFQLVDFDGFGNFADNLLSTSDDQVDFFLGGLGLPKKP